MYGTTILLAEHDDDLRQSLTSLLGHAGFRVLEAADGLDLMAKVRSTSPHLVIVSDRLRGLSGCWAARTIHDEAAEGLYRTRPTVVVLVERQESGVRDRFVRSFTAAADTLEVPLSLDRLEALVERYLVAPTCNAA